MSSTLALTLSAPALRADLQRDLSALGWQIRAQDDTGSAADAVLVEAIDVAALQALVHTPELSASALRSAWVVLTSAHQPELEATLTRMGVEAIVSSHDDAAALSRQLRHAVERKRLEAAARHAYATDLATGLPHRLQLLEHMTQLLALREREPAPMLLLVLRVEGLAQVAQQWGVESAQVLRRKLAVRLRSGLRASDVVAALGDDAFGVLLGRLEHQRHADGVAAKLVQSLHQPLSVAGQPCKVSVSAGMALFPDHGKAAEALLQRALAQAASVVSMGKEGVAARVERSDFTAANDEAP